MIANTCQSPALQPHSARTHQGALIGPKSLAEMQAFQAELDALRQHVMCSLGESDARYVKTLLWLTRGLETAGRSLFILGAWFWPGWLLGVLVLTVAHLIETMELGHNLMHGQFNWMNDPRFEARKYRWNFACEPADWCEFHNLTHHHYSNVQGRDRDYDSLRLTGHRPWQRKHLLQGLVSTIAALTFEWGVAMHNLQWERRHADPQGTRQRAARIWPRMKARLLYTVRREYLWWPLVAATLAAGGAVLVAGSPGAAAQAALAAGTAMLLGNAAAGMLRSVWAYFIIACGHFTAEAHTFTEEDLVGETRAQWYLRQILSAANFRGSVVLDVLSGNASHQIEHHIYPDMPSNRLAQVAPQVEAICRRYNVPYNTGSLPWQVWTVTARILRHSLPGGWYNLTRITTPDEAMSMRGEK